MEVDNVTSVEWIVTQMGDCQLFATTVEHLMQHSHLEVLLWACASYPVSLYVTWWSIQGVDAVTWEWAMAGRWHLWPSIKSFYATPAVAAQRGRSDTSITSVVVGRGGRKPKATDWSSVYNHVCQWSDWWLISVWYLKNSSNSFLCFLLKIFNWNWN